MAPEITKEEKEQVLNSVLESVVLKGSPNLKALLGYLVHRDIDDPGVQAKEYVIATEVFGRSPDYDPQTDSLVRVQIRRLREKLDEYYSNEGKRDLVIKGTLRPDVYSADRRWQTGRGQRAYCDSY